MLIYHDPATERVLYTIDATPDKASPGDWIEAPDDTDVTNLESLRVQGGQLVEFDMAPIRLRFINEVNTTISDIRKQFITPITAQEMIYLQKEKEAVAFIAEDPEPIDLTEFAFISGEIGVTGTTAYEVAQVYLNLATQWKTVGGQLETLRVGTNNAIEAAVTKNEIETIIANFRVQKGAFL